MQYAGCQIQVSATEAARLTSGRPRITISHSAAR
jgi:hypothetical protein